MPWPAPHDKELFELIDREVDRQNSTIQLIASENFASPAVMEATGSVLTNKYSEGYPTKRYYGGNEVIDEVEDLAAGEVLRGDQLDRGVLPLELAVEDGEQLAVAGQVVHGAAPGGKARSTSRSTRSVSWLTVRSYACSGPP